MKVKTANSPISVGMITLGCAKNLVDAEIMLGSLMKEGIEITNDPGEADVVIVNTCSFIDAAQEESVDTILQSNALRETHHPGQGLIVSGCLPQRYRDDLPKLMPEVDAFMGIDQVEQVGDLVRQALDNRKKRLSNSHELPRQKTRSTKAPAAKSIQSPKPHVEVHKRPTFIPDFATPRFRLTPTHTAYVKIAEGCNHPCSFCIIPRMRGSHRSRDQADVVREARQLVRDGARELNLISQDSTYYGLDLRDQHRPNIASPTRFHAAAQALPKDATTLCTLLRELNSIPGRFWTRLLYTHPAHWTDELIQTIAECRKVARYVDIPLQHIHDNMLQRMKRETSRQYIVDLLARIRAGIPGIALRTTFIVGFPGETEACFQSLLEFIRETRFERLGVFTYSKEDQTLAGKMSNQVSSGVKTRRRNQAMAVQHQIASEIAASSVGRVVPVLVEREATADELQQAKIHSWEHGLIRQQDSQVPALKGHYLLARGEADAPDIDGRVYVRGSLPLGRFAKVKIVGHTDYDLVAEPVKPKK